MNANLKNAGNGLLKVGVAGGATIGAFHIMKKVNKPFIGWAMLVLGVGMNMVKNDMLNTAGVIVGGLGVAKGLSDLQDVAFVPTPVKTAIGKFVPDMGLNGFNGMGNTMLLAPSGGYRTYEEMPLLNGLGNPESAADAFLGSPVDTTAADTFLS